MESPSGERSSLPAHPSPVASALNAPPPSSPANEAPTRKEGKRRFTLVERMGIIERYQALLGEENGREKAAKWAMETGVDLQRIQYWINHCQAMRDYLNEPGISEEERARRKEQKAIQRKPTGGSETMEKAVSSESNTSTSRIASTLTERIAAVERYQALLSEEKGKAKPLTASQMATKIGVDVHKLHNWKGQYQEMRDYLNEPGISEEERKRRGNLTKRKGKQRQEGSETKEKAVSSASNTSTSRIASTLTERIAAVERYQALQSEQIKKGEPLTTMQLASRIGVELHNIQHWGKRCQEMRDYLDEPGISEEERARRGEQKAIQRKPTEESETKQKAAVTHTFNPSSTAATASSKDNTSAEAAPRQWRSNDHMQQRKRVLDQVLVILRSSFSDAVAHFEPWRINKAGMQLELHLYSAAASLEAYMDSASLPVRVEAGFKLLGPNLSNRQRSLPQPPDGSAVAATFAVQATTAAPQQGTTPGSSAPSLGGSALSMASSQPGAQGLDASATTAGSGNAAGGVIDFIDLTDDATDVACIPAAATVQSTASNEGVLREKPVLSSENAQAPSLQLSSAPLPTAPLHAAPLHGGVEQAGCSEQHCSSTSGAAAETGSATTDVNTGQDAARQPGDWEIGPDGSYYFCRGCKEGGYLIQCENCPNVWHKDCLPPGPNKDILEYQTEDDLWYCPSCTAKGHMNSASKPGEERTVVSNMMILESATPFSSRGNGSDIGEGEVAGPSHALPREQPVSLPREQSVSLPRDQSEGRVAEFVAFCKAKGKAVRMDIPGASPHQVVKKLKAMWKQQQQLPSDSGLHSSGSAGTSTKVVASASNGSSTKQALTSLLEGSWEELDAVIKAQKAQKVHAIKKVAECRQREEQMMVYFTQLVPGLAAELTKPCARGSDQRKRRLQILKEAANNKRDALPHNGKGSEQKAADSGGSVGDKLAEAEENVGALISLEGRQEAADPGDLETGKHVGALSSSEGRKDDAKDVKERVGLKRARVECVGDNRPVKATCFDSVVFCEADFDVPHVTKKR